MIPAFALVLMSVFGSLTVAGLFHLFVPSLTTFDLLLVFVVAYLSLVGTVILFDVRKVLARLSPSDRLEGK